MNKSIKKIESSKLLMNMYFKLALFKCKGKIRKKIKGDTVEEKKQYVKDIVATLCILLDQSCLDGLGYKGVTFDGVLTFVLNKYKNINFKYSDWKDFYTCDTFNEELGRMIMTQLYNELEYAVSNRKN